MNPRRKVALTQADDWQSTDRHPNSGPNLSGLDHVRYYRPSGGEPRLTNLEVSSHHHQNRELPTFDLNGRSQCIHKVNFLEPTIFLNHSLPPGQPIPILYLMSTTADPVVGTITRGRRSRRRKSNIAGVSPTEQSRVRIGLKQSWKPNARNFITQKDTLQKLWETL
ncbi:hypothetical protein FXO38_14862 [Capsicum annuum]|nr:hypothetical protein FXO38_14862 [Capsicum annuum]KAF3657153.1 hypothetical protein FXO37_15096 [Capsicum annuum]